MASFAADALIEKAEEAYSLGLITVETLERVTVRAMREPGYNAILDLPFDHEIEAARALAKRAARRQGILRRLFV